MVFTLIIRANSVNKNMRANVVSLSKKTSWFAMVLLLAFSWLATPLIVQAQGNQQSGSGLQLSPTRKDMIAQPGEKETFSILLKNITAVDLTAQAVLNDFESDNDSGTPQIIIDQTKRTPYTLEKMLKGYTTVDLKPGETKEVKLTLDVPAGTTPGAYFGAVRYSAVPKGQTAQSDRQVALTASVAHLVFVEVPGEINEQIQIESLKATYDNKPGTFFFKKPDNVALQVKNLGTGLSRPFGKVNVNGPFGKEVHTYDVNNTDPRGLILPTSSRTFNNELKNVKWPGKYTLTGSVAYGSGGEVVTYKSSFVYMPWWCLLVLIVLIVLIVSGGYWIYRSRFGKRKKSKIHRR